MPPISLRHLPLRNHTKRAYQKSGTQGPRPFGGTLRWDSTADPWTGTLRWDPGLGRYGRTLRWDTQMGL